MTMIFYIGFKNSHIGLVVRDFLITKDIISFSEFKIFFKLQKNPTQAKMLGQF
jgi:hypothetical protein